MRSTLRTLKNNRNDLTQYLAYLDTPATTWEGMSRRILTTGTSFSAFPKRIALPDTCLDNATPAAEVKRLYNALFQPREWPISDDVMFVEAFNALANRWQAKGLVNAPKLCKGVSYPSQLKIDASGSVITSDNIWILDLFTRGVAYTKQIGDTTAYVVADTTIYEGWNRFTETEFKRLVRDLPSSNAGPVLVDRYLRLLAQYKYEYIVQNTKVRGRYIRAICKVLGLPEPVRAEDLMTTETFGGYLSLLLDKNNARTLFPRNKNPDSYCVRDFSPFVFAEELTLRDMYGVDAYTGPIREELPISVKVLGWHRTAGTEPTPVIWYTRPNRLPELNFTDSDEKVATILGDPQNETLLQFVAENLVRISLLENKEYTTADSSQVVAVLVGLLRNIENTFQTIE